MAGVTPCLLCPDDAVGPVPVRVLSSGVDTLHLSVRGSIRPDVWAALEASRDEARASEEPVMVELGDSGQASLIKPHGLRGYTLWLSSPDCELLLGRSERFPAALVQLHSAYLHSMGVEAAVVLVEQALRREVFAGAIEVTVSRIDLYADMQGWALDVDDLGRFVCLGRKRRGHLEAEHADQEQVHTVGRRLTGFVFGRGDLLCRIYDKTEEIKRRGSSWLPDLWGERSAEHPVWRVELQVRRAVLVEFGLRSMAEAMAGVQDLWRYGTETWLTYRQPNGDARARRWPVDPVWRAVQAVTLSPEVCGVVRRRIQQVTEERLVQGLQGYLTALAALRGWWDLPGALEGIRPLVESYLMDRERSWAGEVQRKNERRMSVTGWLEEEAA
jgi:hypothetical protein